MRSLGVIVFHVGGEPEIWVIFFDEWNRFLMYAFLERCANVDVVNSAEVVFPPENAMTFEAIVYCCFPCLKKLMTVVVHVKAIVDVVFPYSRVTCGAVCRVVGVAAGVFFVIGRARWGVVRRIHPEVIFVVLFGVRFDSRRGRWVTVGAFGWRWGVGWFVVKEGVRGRELRPGHHGVGRCF